MISKLVGMFNLKYLLPTQSPEGDQLYNRRKLAYMSIAFTVYWSHLILAVYVFALYKTQPSDAAIIAAFLAVPGTIAGMNVWKYLLASEKEDELKSITASRSSASNNSDTSTTVEGR